MKRTPLKRGISQMKRSVFKRKIPLNAQKGIKVKRKKVKPKAKRVKSLHNKAWDLWSIYIRTRDKGQCFTCPARSWNEELGEYDIRGMQAGHYRHGVRDFDDKNIHCQCVTCNKWKHGKLDIYGRRLIEKYGLEEYVKLNARCDLAQKGEKLTEDEYRELIEEIKSKLLKLGIQK